TNSETSFTSSADVYTYVARPAVTAVSPKAGRTTGGNAISISGSGFSGATAVAFGGVPASFLVNNSASISAVAPAHTAGTVDVTVTSVGGTSAASAADHYTYDARPTVTSVSPAAGPTAGGNTVFINGTNFVPASGCTPGGCSAKFGTVSASVSFVSTTQLKAVVPPHAVGTVDVTVTNPGGTSATSSADHYPYDARPTVSSLNPTAGPSPGGNTVTINGANFLSGAGVKFGATASASVTFVSGT